MRRSLCAALALSALTLALPAAAQRPFPEPGRPLTVIVPYPPGGGSDVTARALAPELERTLGVPVVVVNRAGASSQIGMAELARSRPDGYTIAYGLWPTTFTLYLDPSRHAPFTRQSFAPLAMHVIDPGTILVPANSPIRSFAELVAAARARPGAVSMADPGPLGWEHISSVQLQRMLNIEFNQIHYQGGGPAATAAIGGQVDAVMTSLSTARTQSRAGTLRVLATLTDRPSAELPGVPTLTSLGTALTAGSARGFVAAAGTPEPIMRRLAEALEAAINSPAHREALARLGLEATFMGPAEFDAYWTREENAMRPVIEEIVKQGQNN
ncbi:tripartite tricarboxylate transporter substrate binding protein [Rhodovarius crocodyli]|uniref:Tripartite tricarboxylate transporter substrate binding protein n=1 Tax=Rhodovarius crocodyli TaxID=1979269 RepID=A0A437M1P6_9PROT|nr:tripartite tricarboxylate transporter substrate binding protein [Rhodovarius crocodyli]RVT91522.1 tripartite tricarboxylate transporter substrate binding protein [Rhodovarius crocodyli]